jgi:hypothetical protein
VSDHGATPSSIYTQRLAHKVAGIIVTVWLIGVAVYALSQRSLRSNPEPITMLFLATWLIWPVAYIFALSLARLRFETLLERASRSRVAGDDGAPPEMILQAMDRILVARSAERGSSWRLIALCLLFPLTLHYLIAGGGTLLFAHRLLELDDFGKWIHRSVIVVGHAHLVLAFMAWLHAKKLEATPTAILDSIPRRYGTKAWLITTASAVFSAVPIALSRTIRFGHGEVFFATTFTMSIVLLTGLPALYFFSRMRKRIVAERKVLDIALLGHDESGTEARMERLAAIAAWKNGPDNLRLLALEALTDQGHRLQARTLIDQLLPHDQPPVRRKLLAMAIEFYHRPPVDALLIILRDHRDPISMRHACKLLELLRDPKAEPALLRTLDHPNDDVVAAAADALARCGTVTAVESLRRLTRGMLRRGRVVDAAQNAIDHIHGRIDPQRAHGELSVVGESVEGAVSLAREGGSLSVVDKSPT